MILEVPIQEHLQMTSNGKSFRREAMIWRPPFIWLEIDVNYLKFMLRVFWSAVVPKQQKKDKEFFWEIFHSNRNLFNIYVYYDYLKLIVYITSFILEHALRKYEGNKNVFI